MNWQPPTTRPSHSNAVLVWGDGKPETGYWKDGGWFVWDGGPECYLWWGDGECYWCEIIPPPGREKADTVHTEYEKHPWESDTEPKE